MFPGKITFHFLLEGRQKKALKIHFRGNAGRYLIMEGASYTEEPSSGMSSVQNTAEAGWTRNWKNQRGCRSSYVLTGVRWSALLWGLFYPISPILLLVPRRGFCELAPEKRATATQGEEPTGVLCGGGGGGRVGWAGVTRDRHRLSAHSGGEPSSQPAGLTGRGDCFKVSGGAKLGGCVHYWVCLSGSVGQSVCLQCGRPEFDPWVGKILWRRKWLPTPILLPEKSHGQRSLVGSISWGHRVGHDWVTSLSFSSVLGSRSVLKDGEGAPDPLLAEGTPGLQ